MSVGPESSPLTNIEPMQLARALLYQHFSPPDRQGLYEWRGKYWQWDGSRWSIRCYEDLEDEVFLSLENAHYIEKRANGDTVVKRLGPTAQTVAGAMRALETIIRLRVDSVPCWLEGEHAGQTPNILTFKDCLVDIEASATKGDLVTRPLTPS